MIEPGTAIISENLAARLDRMEKTQRQILEILQGKSDWMSVADAAAAFGVETNTINRWVRDGQFEAQGAGKNRRVRQVAT